MTDRSDAAPAVRTVVVVGNGMVGWKLCEKLVKLDGGKSTRLVVFGDEPRPAYDRVQLTSYFGDKTIEELTLADAGWYAERGIALHTGTRVTAIDRGVRSVTTDRGSVHSYDQLVLATGSSAFIPPLPGIDLPGVFAYRTIEDLDAILAHARTAKRCAVLGGGLLGLEAARAVQQCGLAVHVVEMAPRLMPRQLDETGARLLARSIGAMGVTLHLGARTAAVEGTTAVSGLRFDDGELLDVDMIVVSAGIRPRDELARAAALQVGERGGIVVDDAMRTSDPSIMAIGESALHRGFIYGLVAPGYEMAEVAARNLLGGDASFAGADLSTKLKLLGVDVASFGDPFDTEPSREIVYQDFVKGVYKKLVLSADGRALSGGILVGDATQYTQLLHLTRTGAALPPQPEALILGARGDEGGVLGDLPDEAQVCSCNNVTKGAICHAIRETEGHIKAPAF